MKKYSLLLALFSTILTINALAGTMGIIEPERNWVGTISLGPVWENAGRTQTFYLTPEIEKTYVANKSTNALFDGEIFGGYQKKLPYELQGQLGLAVAVISSAKLSGIIWDDADPEFDNYVYSYKIQHTHIAVKGKLLADRGYWLIPWISASIGVGFNRSYSYIDEPVIFEAILNPSFESHTKTAFTYTLGIGVQKDVCDHWQIGVGYEFASWGQSGLDRAAGQTLNSGPSLNHLYTNGILFNITYLVSEMSFR